MNMPGALFKERVQDVIVTIEQNGEHCMDPM